MLTVWNRVTLSGVYPEQPYSFSDKLISRNKLAFLCILFSMIYVFYFSLKQLYLPLFGISFGILLFSVSIVLNRYRYYAVSSILILLNTNYCVLFFSLYLGFDSGIHLYLFTAPLIVLTLFDKKNILVISLAMLSYLVNFCVVVVAGKYYAFHCIDLPAHVLTVFYTVNFGCSLFLLATLSLYFLFNNHKVNQLLSQKNDELSRQQQLLSEENAIRRKAEMEARESLAQREVLLSEIHHRVKNNLAVINGLMELQSVYVKDPNTISVIKDSQNRIKSLAILHEKLYENKTLEQVDIASYVEQLLEFVRISFSVKNKHIEIITKIDSLNLEMSKAMPFSFLLNELISNSFKHAFTEKESGIVEIIFRCENGRYILDYSDTGKGFNYAESSARKSLGISLIETFAKQLNASFSFSESGPGMKFTLSFL